MNVVRNLRELAGVTQVTLAEIAGTSQPTIALYESGAKSPTLKTLTKLAQSLGLELVVSFTSPLSREDRRSLAYHRTIAEILKRTPDPAISRAHKVLAKMKMKHGEARSLFNEWTRWLDLPIHELISRLTSPDPMAREMRQVSPFAGQLSPRERAKILNRFRKEDEF